MVDAVAQCLSAVKKQLDQVKIPYKIAISRPNRNLSNLDEECLYVIRQQVDSDGVYHLVAAAKMAKEKC
jgi:hypothetical protein